MRETERETAPQQRVVQRLLSKLLHPIYMESLENGCSSGMCGGSTEHRELVCVHETTATAESIVGVILAYNILQYVLITHDQALK